MEVGTEPARKWGQRRALARPEKDRLGRKTPPPPRGMHDVRQVVSGGPTAAAVGK